MRNLKETIQKKTDNSYGVKIYDYLTQKWIYAGHAKTYEEAYIIHNNAQFDYYMNKRYLLPKCIALDTTHRKFTFVFTFNGKVISKKYDSLQQAISAKTKFINKLIE